MSTTTETMPATGATETLVQRVVLPAAEASPELLPVYLRAGGPSDAGGRPDCTVVDRRTVQIPGGSRVSFDTFFNAFPAAYWRRWTDQKSITLVLELTGTGRIDIYRSGRSGRVTHVQGIPFDSPGELRIELPLAGLFFDGGYYWFSLSAEAAVATGDPTAIDPGVVLTGAGWHVADPITVRPASLGMCSFNRPDDANATLARLIADPDAVQYLAKAFVVDQGDKHVSDHPDFAQTEQAWGGRLVVVQQPNLGGSGGFSRAMYETLQDASAGDVILTDDDIFPEPESFYRAVMFNSATIGQVIVHGHMLDLWAQTKLHNTGDLVDRTTFSTRAVDPGLQDLDLADNPIARTPALSRRFEGQFGGWWMCLIPREVLEKIGLSLPIFIKWDDVEYGLRAYEAGYPTITMPGVGVWHMPFYVKDVQTDWTAYFECRNRLMASLIYGDSAQIKGTVMENFRIVMKNAFTMNYSALALHSLALEDLLKGPAFIAEDLPTVVGRVRAERAPFSDAKVLPTVPADFDSKLSPIKIDRITRPPKGRIGGALNIAKATGAAFGGLVGLETGERSADLSGRSPHWAVLARLDKAAVSTSDGQGVTIREKDTQKLREMMRRMLSLHLRVIRESDELSRTYRDAMPELVSPEAWGKRFS